MIQTFSELKEYVSADLCQYVRNPSFNTFCRSWFTPGFRFTFFLRCCQYFCRNYKGALFLVSLFFLRHYQFKYGIAIHYSTEIGKGFRISHFGGIVVNPSAVIGQNVCIHPGVLIGLNYDKQLKQFGYPRICNNAVLKNNSKVIGGITIGENALVGVSAVVTKDVPKNAVVVGIPAKVISFQE